MFLLDVTQHKAFCDYWMGGLLQIMFVERKKTQTWQPWLELPVIHSIK